MAELASLIGKSAEMTTLTGLEVNLLNPDPKTLTITDIAQGLSNLCRYAGQVSQFYSVAHHSVLVAELVAQQHPNNPKLILAALLHDATEAYLVDIPSPLKKLMPQYVQIEDNFAAAVAKRFGFPEEYFVLVKPFDIAIRPDEMTQLTRYGKKHLEGPVLGIKIETLSPEQSKRLFLDVYENLVLRLPRLKDLGAEKTQKAGVDKATKSTRPREISLA